jgi:hypothetical protein
VTSPPRGAGGETGRPARQLTASVAETAALAGAIERWAADLALGEEPARFVRALEDGAR